MPTLFLFDSLHTLKSRHTERCEEGVKHPRQILEMLVDRLPMLLSSPAATLIGRPALPSAGVWTEQPSVAVADAARAFPFSGALLVADAAPGPQLSDLFYIVGVIAVIAFGARQVFDSIFPENDEYVPPMPTLSSLPVIGGLFDDPTGGMDPAEKAEELRAIITRAAAEGDIETAYRTEKQLKQLLAETGVRFMVDDDAAQEENLPKKW